MSKDMFSKKIILILLTILLGVTRMLLSDSYSSFFLQSNTNQLQWVSFTSNLIASSSLCLVCWTFRLQFFRSLLIDVLMANLLYIVPESISLFLPLFGVFEFFDLVAFLIGGSISLMLFYLLGIEKYYLQQFRNQEA